jgi:hypothetical protein
MNTYQTSQRALQTLVNLHLIPADVAASAASSSDPQSWQDAASSGISGAKAAYSLIETLGKGVPQLGANNGGQTTFS